MSTIYDEIMSYDIVQLATFLVEILKTSEEIIQDKLKKANINFEIYNLSDEVRFENMLKYLSSNKEGEE